MLCYLSSSEGTAPKIRGSPKSTAYGLIIAQLHNDPFPFGLIAQLVEHLDVQRWSPVQLFKILFPLQQMKRPALQNKLVGVLRMDFWDRNVFGTLEKRAPGPSCCKG